MAPLGSDRRADEAVAADLERAAGAPGKAQLLLDRARDHLYDRLQDGLAKLAQGAIYHALDQPAQAAAVLVAAAADLATLDMRLARGPAGRAYGRGGLQARSRSTGRLPARSPRPPAPCRSGRTGTGHRRPAPRRRRDPCPGRPPGGRR